jgi:4'-phosphopantetheinyl transferase
MGWEQVEVLVEKFEGQGVTVSALPSALSRSERERAGRFRFARDRERYVWRQTRLRMVLAERLGCGAEEVEYAFSEQGKPGLGGRFAGAGLWFSLSHSDGLMAIALSERGEVGVDVERVRVMPDLEALARRCLSEGEWGRFQTLEAGDRNAVFLDLWTRKEAVLKAMGTGLLVEPNRVTVDELDPDEVGVYRVEDPRDREFWWVRSFASAEGWLGSLSISAG